MGALLDLTGQVFGKLTALRREGSDKRKQALWVCQCICGRHHKVAAKELRSGNTKSCGACWTDLTGRTFGRLTVSEHAGFINGRHHWLCNCICGSQTTVKNGDLLSGSTASCGCLRREANSAVGKLSVKDLTGQKFGNLTVQSRCGSDKHNTATWNCLCSCGNSIVVRGYNLLHGKTKGCGCRELAWDLTGRIFGRLTVLNMVERTPEYQKKSWECLCVCGNRHTVLGSSLKSGYTISCGCARIDQPGLRPRRAKELMAGVCARRRTRKTKAGGSFTVAEIEILYNKQRGKCAEPTCRKKLNHKYHRDHIIPVALGGSSNIHNIALLCESCNVKKGSKHPIEWAKLKGRLL